MRKLAIVMALASTALASPALARDDSWYVGIEGGAMIVEDINFDVEGVRNVAKVNHDYGFDVDGVVGYDFGPFRVETEVGYRRADVDSFAASSPFPGYNSAGTMIALPIGTYRAGGETSALSFMLNGLLDFGDDNGIQGFVGGGVGVARVKAHDYAVNTGGSSLDDSDTVFAYQGLAGIRAPLTSHIDATLKYRFFTADKVRLTDVGSDSIKMRFRSHSLLGGVTFNFGEPPAPPPPPVEAGSAAPPLPPEAPPAPPEVVCSPGPYIVFFDWDKSDITPQAASLLDNAVSQYQSCGNTQVMLAGHADRSGSASYNVGLSQRRADSVKAYLTAHAIPDGVITTSAFGESRPRIETADGVRELENRRVEISYGPGSGS